jgi:hypothetical protein
MVGLGDLITEEIPGVSDPIGMAATEDLTTMGTVGV